MKKLVKVKSKAHVPFGFKVSGNVICVRDTDSVYHAAKVLADKNIGVVLVKSQDGRMIGILSERDIVSRLVAERKCQDATKVTDIMTKKVVTVNLDEGLDKVHNKMREIKFRHLPITRGDKVLGIISNRDLMYLRRLYCR